jgi:FlaA1/EpsC-like NDP-sugar epimerase
MGLLKNGGAGGRHLYIIGTGFAARTLADEFRARPVLGSVAAFLDDDSTLIGRHIDGIPVLGPIEDIARLLNTKNVDEAVIAKPEADSVYLEKLYNILKSAGFEHIRILPGISQIVDGQAHLIQTRQIKAQDLLGRMPVAFNLKKSLSYLRGKRVMVTGAGGSIGSELCRQLLSGGVERLYLFGHGENSIYEIDKELRTLHAEGVGEKTSIVPIIGELKDAAYMDWLLHSMKADAVFHTAAYKHVPLMEENPVAVIENNVFGTLNLVNACKKNNVKTFVLISTDKAVEPCSIYGVSKYLCEKIVLNTQIPRECLGGGEMPNTNTIGDYMVVRFANVLGSRGSIVPLFQKQIERGGPVTITDPDMTRYFMTIPEACSLVLKAGGVGENRNLYILDMGEPIRIVDIAAKMIRFYGYEPDIDIKLQYIGVRKGERLDEKLFTGNEVPVTTAHTKILRIQQTDECEFNLTELLNRLEPICYFKSDKAGLYRNIAALKDVIAAYVPAILTLV